MGDPCPGELGLCCPTLVHTYPHHTLLIGPGSEGSENFGSMDLTQYVFLLLTIFSLFDWIDYLRTLCKNCTVHVRLKLTPFDVLIARAMHWRNGIAISQWLPSHHSHPIWYLDLATHAYICTMLPTPSYISPPLNKYSFCDTRTVE